ncbi:hypothetical protein GINT2_001698 [Glugoides intestinalis]
MKAKINVIMKAKLKKQPTSISTAFGRVYVATKGKRIFFSSDCALFKTIRFSSSVNTLSSSKNILFCGQTDGTVFGLDSNHKTEFKTVIGNSSCIESIYNHSSNELLIGTENKKISIYGQDASLRASYFVNNTPFVSFSLSKENLIACISQLEQTVQLIDLNTKQKSTLKYTDGFPEVIEFLKDDSILVGSSTGVISCFSLINKKKVSFLNMKNPITAIHVINKTLFLVGSLRSICLVDFSSFNKMNIVDELEVDGIPVAFDGKDDIYCAVSRESRLGRWQKCKEGHNQLLKMNIGEKGQD